MRKKLKPSLRAGRSSCLAGWLVGIAKGKGGDDEALHRPEYSLSIACAQAPANGRCRTLHRYNILTQTDCKQDGDIEQETQAGLYSESVTDRMTTLATFGATAAGARMRIEGEYWIIRHAVAPSTARRVLVGIGRASGGAFKVVSAVRETSNRKR